MHTTKLKSPHHLLTISELKLPWIHKLIERTAHIKKALHQKGRVRQDLNDIFTALLFYEHSTRTKASFSLAANRLGSNAMTMETQFSSTEKGESLRDTVLTLEAMGYHFIVLRSSMAHAASRAAEVVQSAHMINAGDGSHEHPTQALLDAFTLLEKRKNLKQLKVLFVGDVAHSRVARSTIEIFRKLGVGQIMTCGPKNLSGAPALKVKHTTSLDNILPHVDVIYTLRIQFERHKGSLNLTPKAYRHSYGITTARVKELCKKNVLIMHPGPMNAGVEIDREVADGEHSAILDQVANGVPVRMAVMQTLHERCGKKEKLIVDR